MNRVVIITGGTRGIGFATAKAFLLNGDKVVINYRSDEKKAKEALQSLKSNYDDVIAVQADITIKKDRERLLDDTLKHFKKIDILINNAGVAGRKSFLKETEEEFENIIRNNLTGHVFLAQLVANEMIQQQSTGSIINLCSTASYSPTSGTVSYCAAKAGLLIATKSMAYKLGPYGIRVNSITPGSIETDMSRHAWEDPERGPALEKALPLRRRGQPDEIAGAVLYLTSDQASYTTGADIIIDGGWLLRSGLNKR